MVGLINRTKSIWSGRKGPNLNQFFFDLKRLLFKVPVYSSVSSWIFQISPWLVLVTSLTAASLCPILPGYSPFSFSYDFIYFSYLLGLGRVFMILGALDTGSSFEGMGASREATFSALIEPALFFVLGTLGILSGKTSFHDLMFWNHSSVAEHWIKVTLVLTLFILLQVESARLPVDDPNTHLELTMIHEVMVLDHSGPELGAIQYGAAIKMTLIAGLIAAVINPLSASDHVFGSFGISAGIMCALAIGVGLTESLMARLKLRAVPAYILIGVALGLTSLIVSVLSQKGAI
jgi:formate hydrogenlyase subunit 4